MVDQEPTSEVPRIKLAPFDARSLRHERPGKNFSYIDSQVLSTGSLSMIGLTATRYMTEEVIVQEFEENDIAITLDSMGKRQESNARELLRKGGYLVDASFYSPFDFDDIQQLTVALNTEDGIPLITSDLLELGEDGPTEVESRVLQRLGPHMKAYTSVLCSVEPDSKGGNIVKPVIVQKDQLIGLRVAAGLGGDTQT
jgi:hypothetical protein